MIAPRQFRPLLQNGHCVVADYDEVWIESVLRAAAEEAGVRLPFAHEIARAVMIFLEEQCPMRALPLEYLFSRMRKMLDDIGMSLVALHLRTQTPPVDIDLDSLAQEKPLPLFFYAELQRRMEELRRMGMTTYRFIGRKRCSLKLGARLRACPTQRRELAELDGFLQHC